MSNDAAVTKDLIQTLEDGKDGFAKGAEKLEKDGETALAGTFRDLSASRATMSDELQKIAAAYGDQIEESGSVAAKAHRGWMTVKDALAGSDPDGVLDAAEQGEDHAVSEFEKALQSDISPEFKTVVQRQLTDVRSAHDQVKALRDARR
ncbi:PA2169 family four-helix-bundle protein [Aquihabitans daechungensis]|uniref:PA2169 family four-helix-bundle protein n=1 Tax=Aquihabitans daechungensis TaxID=1052257 RepID=UPI003BA0135F